MVTVVPSALSVVTLPVPVPETSTEPPEAVIVVAAEAS